MSNHNISEMVQLLRDHNRWRRGANDINMANPVSLGMAIETVCAAVEQLTTERWRERDGSLPKKEIVSEKTFRSHSRVNDCDDMVRVTIDMERKVWRVWKHKMFSEEFSEDNAQSCGTGGSPLPPAAG